MAMDGLDYDWMIRACRLAGARPTLHALIASIGEQKLAHYRDGRLVRVFPISTSLAPPSGVAHSQGTPLGLHAVGDKIGDREPLGMVFRGRVPTGGRFQDLTPEENRPNLVTSRILRLRGLEPGFNQGPDLDSYERFIYLHGTNHEERIGRPASHGCLLLTNADMVELFESLPEASLVWIGLR